MDKKSNLQTLEHYAWVWKTMGERALIQTCSSALLVICKSPIFKRTRVYWDSEESLSFIKDNGIKRIVDLYHLDIDVVTFIEAFFEKAYYIKDKYYVENTSI